MEWEEAYSQLNSAVEVAYENGMTEDEIRECVDNAIDNSVEPKPFVGGGPKPKKKGK